MFCYVTAQTGQVCLILIWLAELASRIMKFCTIAAVLLKGSSDQNHISWLILAAVCGPEPTHIWSSSARWGTSSRPLNLCLSYPFSFYLAPGCILTFFWVMANINYGELQPWICLDTISFDTLINVVMCPNSSKGKYHINFSLRLHHSLWEIIPQMLHFYKRCEFKINYSILYVLDQANIKVTFFYSLFSFGKVVPLRR